MPRKTLSLSSSQKSEREKLTGKNRKTTNVEAKEKDTDRTQPEPTPSWKPKPETQTRPSLGEEKSETRTRPTPLGSIKKKRPRQYEDNRWSFKQFNAANEVPLYYFTVLSEFCRLVDDKLIEEKYSLIIDTSILGTLGIQFKVITENEFPDLKFDKVDEYLPNGKSYVKSNLYPNTLKPHFEKMVHAWLVSGEAENFFKSSKRKSTSCASPIIKSIAKSITLEQSASEERQEVEVEPLGVEELKT